MNLRVFACLLLVVLAHVIKAIDVSSLVKDFVNDRVVRTVNLSTSIVKEDIGIRANNTGTKATAVYHFTIPMIHHNAMASYHAFLKQKAKHPLVMELAGFDQSQQLYVYIIHIDPLERHEEIKIGIRLTFTHMIKPLPEKIPQISKQHVTYAGNILTVSPYPTKDIKTTFIFPTENIVTYTGGEPNQEGKRVKNTVVYGPLNNIPPLSTSPCNFHYEYKNPIITITSLKREIQVSHWGANLAVEEHYALRHDGAKYVKDIECAVVHQIVHELYKYRLDSEFSRIKHQLAPHVLEQTNVLTKLVFDLPQHAADVYYRDEVGNVSTSHFRNEKHKSVLEIEPRFPLFGGWKTTWYMGYNVPLQQYGRYNKEKDEYILKVNFIENVKDNMSIDEVEFKVILPEGAMHIQVTPPSTFSVDSIEEIKHFTFFDSTGRVSVVFHKKNVVKDHEATIYISYKLSSFKLLQKPMVVSFGFLVICFLSIIASKIPFTIGEKGEMNRVIAKKGIQNSLEQVPALSDFEDEPIAANTRREKPHVSPILLGQEKSNSATSKKKKSQGKKGKKVH